VSYLFQNETDRVKAPDAMAGLSTALIFFTMAITGYIMAEFITIVRDGNLKYNDFSLPASQCPLDQHQCGNFNGTSLSICWCFCGNLQGQNTSFYEPGYGCLRGSDVRQQAGMTVNRLLKSKFNCAVWIDSNCNLLFDV